MGTKDSQRGFLQELIQGGPTEPLRALVEMEDTPACFQILRLVVLAKTAFTLRMVCPEITKGRAEEFDKHVT